jgi:hypothetical protein
LLLWPRTAGYFTNEKIVSSYRPKSNEFTIVDGTWFCGTDVYMILSKTNKVPHLLILGILNSKFVRVWLDNRCAKKGDALELNKDHLSNIPFPITISQTIADAIKSKTSEIIKAVDKRNTQDEKVLQAELNSLVISAYGLTDNERQVLDLS